MRDDEDGSRIGIVMNGSPLFSGGAQSGESEIRRWMLENDWVEAIVALPTDLFYNTGIQTYVWLLTNRKPALRQGKVQLIDASGESFWKSMRKSLGKKRREIHDEARAEIVKIHASFLDGNSSDSEISKIFDTEDFGYREIRVERPLRLNFRACEERISNLYDENAFKKLSDDHQSKLLDALKEMPDDLFTNRDSFSDKLANAIARLGFKVGAPLKKAILNALSERDGKADICNSTKGAPEPDTELRDYETVPLKEDWKEFLKREVIPFVSDAWVDESYLDEKDRKVGRIGYEINFRRYFYAYDTPRSLAEIDSDLKNLERDVRSSLEELVI